MKLFELKDFVLTFSPQALALKAFKALWDRDKSKTKKKAIAELSYVWYYTDIKSDYQIEPDNLKRSQTIIENLPELGKDWKPDGKVADAVEFYEEMSETISTKLLKNAKSAANKISDYISNLEVTDADSAGKLVRMLKDLPMAVQAITEAEEQIRKTEKKQSNVRGDKEKSLFEDV